MSWIFSLHVFNDLRREGDGDFALLILVSTGQIASLIPFFSPLLCFKNENVKVKVKYGFVLHTGLSFAL
jgi:hypothetical protein